MSQTSHEQYSKWDKFDSENDGAEEKAKKGAFEANEDPMKVSVVGE